VFAGRITHGNEQSNRAARSRDEVKPRVYLVKFTMSRE
jgi:hypothetical protein